ncbi:RelA/SpoT domain-containing protein [Arthrobacter bambusae]|uniref:PpGpp synthetase/RelA/SpoT-type nucleotidyltransferase n=1 Tax=Arthrobacter bambusae TaxID=1338426 RepID=A0AAW8DE50_9MICC|nr:RelA/SpoT domain-containing protein [Arthrobacter bambusae]MDP9904560.1 ppGpp synthetase/RelA/SpoT-type nucleotidyltransferase [Arthrobacter bambusae]MDQ0129375.1 ppGpp synthetase/RelA/SpoT-type nucleotidyltransferase [Arthrobacter bambusae]MDQ0181012.1 ppGpp synthetase/RelA/SpoT-type nucleotidyltransferase [Arthrobacter bambusae]
MTEEVIDPPPSKTAVRNAGSTIREYMRGECSQDALDAALKTIRAYRAQFSDPLVTVQTRLRQIHQDLEMQGEPSQKVTQRLKKSTTIVDKLVRESGLNLARMQDIGGCRMVVETLEHLRMVEAEVRNVWGDALHHTKDYIEDPRESGYRAVHMIVVEAGQQIEIQLRTESMHSWAMLVEAFSGIAGQNLKQDGEHLIQDFLRLMSDMTAAGELGQQPTEDQLDNFRRLRDEVTEYLDAFAKEAGKDQP